MNQIIKVTNISIPNNGIPQKYRIHRLSLKLVIFLSLVFWIFSFVFSAENLPDYDSYNKIYKSVSGYSFSGWEPFFVYLNYLGKYFQLNYDEFRSVILFLSLTSFAAAMSIFSWKLRDVLWKCPKQCMFTTASAGLIFALAYAVFFFEFFFIRIRAGLALSMILLAFSLFWPGRKKTSKLRFLIVAILLGLAFKTHLWTTIALVYFTFYPVVLSFLYSKSPFARQAYFFEIISFFSILVPAVLAVYVILELSFYRGDELFSKLNIFRLTALSVIPLAIIVYGAFGKKYVRLRSILKEKMLNPNSIFLPSKLSRQLMMWHYFVTFSYFSMALALLVFYMAGTVNQAGAGEAIVRLFTLSSPLAVFIILCATKFYRAFWLLVLLSNSLFFVNTVFLSNP